MKDRQEERKGQEEVFTLLPGTEWNKSEAIKPIEKLSNFNYQKRIINILYIYIYYKFIHFINLFIQINHFLESWNPETFKI